MQWEHRIVRADWFGGTVSALRPQGKATVPLATYLDEASADGWEVVGMSTLPTITEVGKLVILLRRQKP